MKLVMILVLLALTGCGSLQSYEELEVKQLVCETEKSHEHPDCLALTDRLMAREERLEAKRSLKAFKESCTASGLKLWCVTQTMQEQCQCVTREAFKRALNDVKDLF